MKSLLIALLSFTFLQAQSQLILKPGYNNDVDISRGQAAAFAGKDTLFLSGTYNSLRFAGLYGKDSLHPLVIYPLGNVLVKIGIAFDGCRYIKVDGAGRLLIEGDPFLRTRKGHGIDIFNRSANFEIANVRFRNLSTFMHVTTFVYCKNQDSLNRAGGWLLHDIYIHDNIGTGAWYEGYYIGPTSPDNTDYDPRIPDGCPTYRPEQMRAAKIRCRNNKIDSTGRGGIQYGAVEGDYNENEIAFNTVTNSGMNGYGGQGTNFSVGTYSHVWVHDNVFKNSLTTNIAFLGGSAIVENNVVENNFTVKPYDYKRVEENDNVKQYDPFTEPQLANTQAADYGNQTSAIYVSTRTTGVKDATGKYIRGYMDSIGFKVAGNKIANYKGWAVWIEDGYNMMRKLGNCVSGNTGTTGAESQIKYSTTCAVTPPVPVPPTPVPPTPVPPAKVVRHKGYFTENGKRLYYTMYTDFTYDWKK